MKKLQKDFTTKQQSEKLLALGMPRLSANFYYDDENEVQIVRDPEFELQSKGYFPCWSAGRLMEIIDNCTICDNKEWHGIEYPSTKRVKDELGLSYIEFLIQSIEKAADVLDFSKLEV